MIKSQKIPASQASARHQPAIGQASAADDASQGLIIRAPTLSLGT